MEQKRTLPTADAAAYLRQLAVGLERGEVQLDGQSVPVDGAIQLRETAREGKLRIGLRVPLARRDAGPEDESRRPSYKGLKKQMKRDFRLLRAAAREGTVPAELVRRFHADCRRMTGHPGKGEPHYGRFNAVADAMLRAAEAGEAAELRRVLDEMAALRDEAHRRYR